MARAILTLRHRPYLSLVAQLRTDVERMPPRLMRAHLQRRLRLVELQIQLLDDKLGAGVQGRRSDLNWSTEPLDDDRWTSLANLSYLVAERDALRDTINLL